MFWLLVMKVSSLGSNKEAEPWRGMCGDLVLLRSITPNLSNQVGGLNQQTWVASQYSYKYQYQYQHDIK
jgi:hypothetical protein